MSDKEHDRKILLWGEDPQGWNDELNQSPPSITPYLPGGNRRPACVVVCPGGGYATKAPHEGAPVARWLNAAGLAAMVLDYRVAPYHHPWPLTDASRAIRFLRANAEDLGVDPERVGILGFSAGGHLAASTGTHWEPGDPDARDPVERHSSRPDFMVLCYPVITFGRHRHTGSMTNLLGDPPDPEQHAELSLEDRVTTDTPPSFIWHTADDQAVPVQNSLAFADALAAHQIPYELHVFAHGPHGVGLASQLPQVSAWTSLCEAWLTAQGLAE